MDWELAIPLALAVDFAALMFVLVVRPNKGSRLPKQFPWDMSSVGRTRP